jgi:hypothetical protein
LSHPIPPSPCLSRPDLKLSLFLVKTSCFYSPNLAPITNFQWPTSNIQFPNSTSHLEIGYWLLVIGYWTFRFSRCPSPSFSLLALPPPCVVRSSALEVRRSAYKHPHPCSMRLAFSKLPQAAILQSASGGDPAFPTRQSRSHISSPSPLTNSKDSDNVLSRN